ncbi:MAG: ABC transporter ATP-binding protein/permease [Firmicutes bacterium]|nr:ABC transporter ATP-binding protein/permease [Bacillota bacterium]
MPDKAKKTKNKILFSAYYKAAKPALKYKWCYVVLTLIGLVLVVADLAFAETSRLLFDLAPDIPQNMAVRIIMSFVIIITVQFIFSFAESYVHSYFNESVIYAMRRETLGKIQRLKMEFYDNNHTSKIAETFFSQIEVVKDFVVSDVPRMIRLPLSFIIIGAYLFTVHPYLGITAILASILQPISNFTFRKPFFKGLDNQRKVTRDVFTTMGEATQGIREVKINQIEDFFDKRMKKYQSDGVKHNLTIVKYGALRGIIRDMPTRFGYVAGIAIGIFLMIDGQINPGDLVAFITLLHKVSEPFNGITQTYSNFQRSLRSANDLLKLVDEPEENYSVGKNLNLPVDNIKFENICFGYNVTETNTDEKIHISPWELVAGEEHESEKNSKVTSVLDNVTFEIKGGSTVALVGPSGGGKSTLIKLLYNFYEPTSGEITINNAPISSYNITSVRNAMSIVSQDIFIFDGTVRENLLLGRAGVTEDDIQNALKYSESYDFVMKLPEGLDSYLGERGVKLSQGQKQRLSIARSIIKKANIIILDEPTSALDVETEYLFQQNIAEWAKGCTKLIIAHRLTTIRDADYVLFLDDGKIVEQGSPYDLIKQDNGKFKEYWEKQFLFQKEDT